MAVRIQYMGAKRRIADRVAELIGGIEAGSTVLDLFCGTCSVAGALADQRRPIWVNDVQRYATEAATCLLTSAQGPPAWAALEHVLAGERDRNRTALVRRFECELAREAAVLATPTVAEYQTAYREWRHVANDAARAREARRLARARATRPYRLATLTFAWGYLGLAQAIEVDSLRCSIDSAEQTGELDAEAARWARLALLQAAARLATGPGHLAQYLRATNESSLARVVAQRRRSLGAQFEIELAELEPCGDADWRVNNRVLSRDALQIWPELRELGLAGAVVYADPPYSKNQYSRFYHVLETLVRYDYPAVSGRGRYRPDRFITGFCRRREVEASFHALCRGVASLGSTLVLSYPADGLLRDVTGTGPERILRNHFGAVERALSIDIEHSTLGAGHGQRDHATRELLLVAR